MSRAFVYSACLALFVASTVRADIVVPNSATGVEGDGTFSLTTSGATGRTYQYVIDESQLTGVIGQPISGLSWRINGTGTAAWPPVNVTFASWDIFVGPGVDPSAMVTTFASNFTSAPTQVRSGAFAVNAGAYSVGSSPNAFGPGINFDTPFLYTGGDLTIEMRMAQQVGSTTQSPFDGILASGAPANGYGVGFAARFAAGTTATTGGAFANFVVTNLVTVPEPTSMLLLGVPLAAAAWRKLRRRGQ